MHTPNSLDSLKNYLKDKYLKLSLVAFSLGVLFLARQKEWLILRSPFASCDNLALAQHSLDSTKQNLVIYYWVNQHWNSELIDTINSSNSTKNLKQLVTSWLNLLSEEKILCQKPALQSVLIDQKTNNLYLSFDRALFMGSESTKEKLLIIESLLKTIREHQITQPVNKFASANQIPIETITFLVLHQPMPDSHLDFTISWPISGFLE